MHTVLFRQIAKDEYLAAINWYDDQSSTAGDKFIDILNKKLDLIAENPYQYKNIYKKFYAVSINKYPYSIVYFVDKILERVIVVAIYHHKRSPKKKYRR